MNPLSNDVVEEFGPLDDSGSFGDSGSDFHGESCGFWECVLVVSLGVLVVTDVSVSPATVGVLGEASPSDSDCEIVKPQFSPVNAPLASRRKILPPTPQQSPQPSIEVTQLQMEVTDQEFACGKEYEGEYGWTARDRVIARREHLDRSESQVEVEELELLLGPEDPQVDLRYIFDECEEEKGSQDL